jgi:hypothetical protein
MFRLISHGVATFVVTLAMAGAAPAVASPDIQPTPPAPSAAALVPVDPASDLIAASPSTAAAASSPTTCFPNVQNPHESTHVPGTVNVVVTVTCTEPVREIAVQAALYRQDPADGLWYLQGASDVKTYYNTTFGQNNAAAPCQDGNWVGWMNYNVVFMSGFSAGDSGFGNQVAITCSA